MDDEVSESGAPIKRYKPREEQWVPPNMEDSQIEKISAHIEQHVGPVTMVWHEIVSDLVHIDVYEVAPTEDRPYWTLVTSGMSDLPMAASEQNKAWAYAELMLCLPKEWKLGEDDLKDDRYYWPIRWLKVLARFPHEYKTWLSWGHSMPNGDPAKPVASDAPFTGIMLLRPKTLATDFWTLKIRDDKIIHFFSVVPLHPGEMDLKLKAGSEEMDRLLDKHKVTEIVNKSRRDVSKRDWWRIW